MLSVIYTALHPEDIKNLIALTLPLDMSVRDIPMNNLMDHMSDEAIEMITGIYGNCPAWLVKAGFTSMAPIHHALDKHVMLYRNRDNKAYVEMFELFERCMNNDVPIAGQIFRELTTQLFKKNLLAKSEFVVGEGKVELKNITCPVLNVVAEKDDVVAPRASLPFIELIGSQDKANLVFPTGHMGAAVSSGAQKHLWPQVAAWLGDRDAQPKNVGCPGSNAKPPASSPPRF